LRRSANVIVFAVRRRVDVIGHAPVCSFGAIESGAATLSDDGVIAMAIY